MGDQGVSGGVSGEVGIYDFDGLIMVVIMTWQ